MICDVCKLRSAVGYCSQCRRMLCDECRRGEGAENLCPDCLLGLTSGEEPARPRAAAPSKLRGAARVAPTTRELFGVLGTSLVLAGCLIGVAAMWTEGTLPLFAALLCLAGLVMSVVQAVKASGAERTLALLTVVFLLAFVMLGSYRISQAFRRVDFAAASLAYDPSDYLLVRDELERAKNVFASLPEVYYNLGLLEDLNDKPLAGVANYTRGLALDPTMTPARVNLGVARLRAGQVGAAVRILEEQCALAPQDVTARINLGLALKVAGRPQAALTQMRIAVRTAPDDLDAHLALGRLLWQQGDRQAALDEFRRSVEMDPSSTTARVNLGSALYARGLYGEAAAQFEHALQQAPSDPKLNYDLGAAYARYGAEEDLQRAIAAFRRAIELAPSFAEAHYNLAIVYMLQTRPDIPAARESLQKAESLGHHIDLAVAEYLGTQEIKLGIEPPTGEVEPSDDESEA